MCLEETLTSAQSQRTCWSITCAASRKEILILVAVTYLRISWLADTGSVHRKSPPFAQNAKGEPARSLQGWEPRAYGVLNHLTHMLRWDMVCLAVKGLIHFVPKWAKSHLVGSVVVKCAKLGPMEGLGIEYVVIPDLAHEVNE